MAKHLANSEEAWLIIFDDAAIRRNINLAIAKCVERIYGFVRRNTWSEMHLYLYFGRRVIVYALGFYLPLIPGFENRVDKRGGVLAERYLTNDERFVVQLLNLGAHLDRTTPLTVVISTGIDRSARGEVGIELERFAFKIVYGRLAQLAHVVGKDF